MSQPVGLNYPRPCGCKGIRRCLVCETEFDVEAQEKDEKAIEDVNPSYCSLVFCTHCSVAYLANIDQYDDKDCRWHETLGNVPSLAFPGVTIFTEFINHEEESRLLEEIEARPWAKSQSGRLKQDYGPKCNFKKRKLKLEAFTGFPSYLQPILAKFDAYPILDRYYTVEQCNLAYDPSRGSSIDPHFDDFWIWGERLLTLSLGSLTFLTMSLPGEESKPRIADDRAALAAKRREEAEDSWKDFVAENESDLELKLKNNDSTSVCDNKSRDAVGDSDKDATDTSTLDRSELPGNDDKLSLPSSCARVHLPMPPRSMMVLYGPARDTWVHEVRRSDIKDKRIAVAFRELAAEFLPGGKSEEVGKQVLDRAARFDGVSRIEC